MHATKQMKSFWTAISARSIFGVFFGALITYSSWSQSTNELVGTWIVESAYPQGMLVDTVEFVETPDGMAGTWHSLITPDGALLKGPVSELRQESDTLSFKIELFNSKRFWTGRFTGKDQLTMRWIADDGHLVRTRIFRRASPEALAEVKADAPKNLIMHPLPLPALRKLPFNGLALTPPMGWSSWNHFKEAVDDRTIREIADAMVSSGLRDAGYVFVNIDDGWQGRRDEKGVLHPNSKFPDMKALADYVHAKGLKLGIYSSPGPITCTGYVGSHGYETQDARTFALWGIDIIRHDWCSAGIVYTEKEEAQARYQMQALYQKMGEALQAAGHPIVYTLCQYGLFDVGAWGRDVGGNMWRTGGDMIEGQRWPTMSERFEINGKVEDNGPGGWNDPDHMIIGIDGMTTEEQRTHMTLWAIQAAPLILGNDIRAMKPDEINILTNKEVLAVDQDALGKQGRRVIKNGSSEVWVKPLKDGSIAVALFNRGTANVEISVRWSDLGLKGSQRVRDLWRHADLGEHADGYSAVVPMHGSVMLRVQPTR